MRTRLVLAAFLLVAACAVDAERELLVSAAASLTHAFTALEAGFEREHPGIDVILNLGATSTLRRQIMEGAPVDVFASADAANMDELAAAGLVAGEPRAFATNRLQIAVRQGNPTGVEGMADLAAPARFVGLCAAPAPCGRLARLALESAGITAAVDSEEPNVRSLLNKIASGEIDVGIVYQSDVVTGEGVEGIQIPPQHNQVNHYLIAVLSASSQPELGEAFLTYVLSPEGQEVLAGHGFGTP